MNKPRKVVQCSAFLVATLLQTIAVFAQAPGEGPAAQPGRELQQAAQAPIQAPPAAEPPTAPPTPMTTPVSPSVQEKPLATTPTEHLSTGVSSKFAAELYGFVEFDAIHDSTQSFNDLAGNTAIARGNYAASHQRTIFGARNSRIGFKLKGPDSEWVKSSAVLEMDFLGNQPSPVSEAGFVTSPTFRIRHMALKLDTPYIYVLIGQYWQLFGWQSNYHPNTVEIQGVPGQIYSRSPQIRLSHTIKTEDVSIEVAVAAVRPPQRDSSTPDGEAGLRLLLNGWKGLHTAGGAGTAIDAASIGVSGIYRRFEVTEWVGTPVSANTKNGSGISVDALIPVIPATPTDRGNSLTLNGSFVRGTGISDLYTSLTGGVGFPKLAAPAGGGTAPTYTPNIDNGMVTYDSSGQLHTIDWLSYMVGIQYYLPPSGDVWLSANFSSMKSNNIGLYGSANSLVNKSLWADGNLFWDVNKAVRLGAEFAWFRQTYVDGVKAHNYRSQFSAYYIF